MHEVRCEEDSVSGKKHMVQLCRGGAFYPLESKLYMRPKRSEPKERTGRRGESKNAARLVLCLVFCTARLLGLNQFPEMGSDAYETPFMCHIFHWFFSTRHWMYNEPPLPPHTHVKTVRLY